MCLNYNSACKCGLDRQFDIFQCVLYCCRELVGYAKDLCKNCKSIKVPFIHSYFLLTGHLFVNLKLKIDISSYDRKERLIKSYVSYLVSYLDKKCEHSNSKFKI